MELLIFPIFFAAFIVGLFYWLNYVEPLFLGPERHACALLLGIMIFSVFFAIGLIRIEANKHQPRVHVVDLGVVEEIKSISGSNYHCVQFMRERGLGYKYMEAIGDTEWFDVTEKQWQRIEKQFVAGKKYIATYQKHPSRKRDGKLLSFYPKD